MSGVFGLSAVNIDSNINQSSENNDKFFGKSTNMRNRNTDGFVVPSIPKRYNYRDSAPKSHLLAVPDLQPSLLQEDISKVDYVLNENEFSCPSTSSVSLYQQKLFKRMQLHSESMENNSRKVLNKLYFVPAPRKGIFTSRSHLNFVRDDSSASSRTFGLGMRNSLLSGDVFPHEKITSVEPELQNSEKKYSFANKSKLSMFGLTSRNNYFKNHSVETENVYKNQNLIMNNESNSAQVILPSFSRECSSNSRQISNGRELLHDRLKLNNDLRRGGAFGRSISQTIRPRNSISSGLFSHSNFDQYNKDLNCRNGFNVTNISKRDWDSVSESRMHSNFKKNALDNLSVAGSVISVAKVMNILENLHYSVLSMAPDMSIYDVRKEFDKAKEIVESEVSYAPSLKEVDAVSVVSHSPHFMCSAVIEKSNLLDEKSLSLKSGKDILKTLVTKKGNNRQNLLSRIDEERKNSDQPTHNQFADEEKEDSALVYKKPRPYFKNRSKGSQQFKIKTPKATKKSVQKKGSQVINLKQWYPFAVGNDLTFFGTNENGVLIQTEAVKKRLNSRKVELINGWGCNLVGSPSSNKIFPENILSQLKNGLTAHWRIFQKNLTAYQTGKETQSAKKSFRISSKSEEKNKNHSEEVRILDTTPKRKKREVSGKKPSPKKFDSSKKFKKNLLGSAKRKISKCKTRVKKKDAITPDGKKITPKYSPSKKVLSPKVDSTTADRSVRTMRAICRRNRFSSTEISSKGAVDSPSMELPKSSGGKSSSPKNQRSRRISPRKSGESVHSLTENKYKIKSARTLGKRKREASADTSSDQKKKSRKSEITQEITNETSMKEVQVCQEKEIKSKEVKNQTGGKGFKQKKKNGKNKKTPKSSEELTEPEEYDFDIKLNDIDIPEVANVSRRPQLHRSQLQLMSIETPPLKYFNDNIKLLQTSTSAFTPVASPSWCISQRTESEVKQFQKRRAISFKRKVMTKKEMVKKSSTQTRCRDVDNVIEWVAEKTVRTPAGKSEILKYMIPSRRRFENDDEDEAFEN